jgi:hypothetical protein
MEVTTDNMEIDMNLEDILKAVLDTLYQIGTEFCNLINDPNRVDVPDTEQPVEE